MLRARLYCRCGSPLARDNADGLCAVCHARRRRARAPELPPEFWRTEMMGEALASGDLGRLLRAYRSHPFHGQPLPQMVVAGWLHVSQTTLSRIEQGKRRLTIDDVNWFARRLGMPWALRWVHEHPSEVREDVDPISRRGLLGTGVGAALGFSAPFATTASASARDIDPSLVSHWMKLLHVLRRHDAMFGPHDALGAVRHELNLIADHRQIARGELRTQLLRVESRWSWFASWLGRDGGDARIADYCADRALRLAQEADDPDMVAYVLMRRSLWTCDPRQATALAETGRRTHGTSAHIRALCALREAHGHALANDAASCHRSLDDAYGLLDQAKNAPQTPWDDLGRHDATPPYVMAEEARCWLRLQPSKAIAMFEDVLGRWPRDRTRGRGIHQAHLALACAAADEPERAADAGVKALNIAQSTRSDVTAHVLKRLDHQLAACDLPAAADFREAFAAL